jgi:hypothetical protein
MAGIFRQLLQILKVAGIGQFVQVDDGAGACGQPVVNKVGADESGASGYDNAWLNCHFTCPQSSVVLFLFPNQLSTSAQSPNGRHIAVLLVFRLSFYW